MNWFAANEPFDGMISFAFSRIYESLIADTHRCALNIITYSYESRVYFRVSVVNAGSNRPSPRMHNSDFSSAKISIDYC